MQPFICTCEVALRNAIHTSLSLQASASSGGTSPSFAWYDHTLGWKKLEGETYAKVEKLLCAPSQLRLPTQPTPDAVVAELSLGVWPNILDQQLTQAQEAKTFDAVFTDHPKRKKGHWRHEANRKIAVERCKDLQKFRNRMAHCGPVWSQGWLSNQPGRHWTLAIDNLKARHADLMEMLTWISASTAEAHAASFASYWFTQLCSQDAVLTFITDPENAGKTIPLPPLPAETRVGYMARR